MASSSKLVAGSDLWWFDHAWNEDSLDWFLLNEEKDPGVATDNLRAIFAQLQPAFPDAAPPADWLARFYIALGDPRISGTGDRKVYGDPAGTSDFVYDPTNTTLSFPMQLVNYYFHFSGGKSRFEMLNQPQISERLSQLLTTIEFTPAEWEWLVNKLEPESLGLFGGLFDLVVNNPVLTRLGPSEALSDYTPYTPIDFIELQTLGALRWLLEETLKVTKKEVPAPSRSAVFDKLNLLVQGANARSHILEKVVEVMNAAVKASIEEHHLSTARAGRPANTRTAEYSFCVNAAQLFIEIDAHPNYDGSTVDLANQIFDELTLGETTADFGLKPFHVLTGDITDPSHRYYTEPESIAHSAGLVPYEEEEPYFSTSETIHLLYALVNFSKEDARKSFQNMVLAPTVSARQVDGPGCLMPMFSVFFSELREAYDDMDRNIPLSWLLEVGEFAQEGVEDV